MIILIKRKYKKQILELFEKENLTFIKKDREYFKLIIKHSKLLFKTNPFGHKTERSKKKYWKKIYKADDLWFKIKNFDWDEELDENVNKNKNLINCKKGKIINNVR